MVAPAHGTGLGAGRRRWLPPRPRDGHGLSTPFGTRNYSPSRCTGCCGTRPDEPAALTG
jgi:hypothetical protein